MENADPSLQAKQPRPKLDLGCFYAFSDRYRMGDFPKCFLKQRIMLQESLNPHVRATSASLPPAFSASMALFKR